MHPVVKGDLEIVEIKCERSAKLMKKQKETYNDLIWKGFPVRMVAVMRARARKVQKTRRDGLDTVSIAISGIEVTQRKQLKPCLSLAFSSLVCIGYSLQLTQATSLP